MTPCTTCNANRASHGKPRPFMALRIDLLEIVAGVETAVAEVRHELGHRHSVGARRLAARLEEETNQPATGPAPATLEDEDQHALRRAWTENELYLHRIDGQEGAARFTEMARRRKAAIEAEWVRRRGFPELVAYWHRKPAAEETGELPGNPPAYGMLSALGYRMRTKGRSDAQRIWLLDAIIAAELPPVSSVQYVAEWGAPLSPQRLDKTIRTLRGLAAMVGDTRVMQPSRMMWLADADYLERVWLGVGRD